MQGLPLMPVTVKKMDNIKRSTGISGLALPTDNGYLTFIFSPTMLIVSHRFRLMEECMYGLSLIRLGMFIALAIIASTAIGLFTYMVVTVLAE
jgi:hypothetical protein